MNFDAAIFDMDGLLLDTEIICKKAFIDTCHHFQISREPVFYKEIIGLDEYKSTGLIEQFLSQEVPTDTFINAWKEEMRNKLNMDIPVKNGVKPLLTYLTSIEFPCGVATSTKHEKAINFLEKADLLPHFQIIVGGDQVNNGKPAPEIYEKAASALGKQPEKCIAFEDSKNGVRAALGAGMTVVQVPDLLPPDEELLSMDHLIVEAILDGAKHYRLYPDE